MAEIRTVAILGAGTMGTGIAQTCILGGLEARLFDASNVALTKAEAKIAVALQRLSDKDRLAEPADDVLRRLSFSTDPVCIAGADLLIEAVFEDLQVKRDLLRRIAPLLGPETVVATNTSALRVTDLATSLPRPGNFLGLHYFSPAEVNPLVEVVLGPATSDLARDAAETFLRQTGKQIIFCRDESGFVVNRFFCPYCNEAVRLMDEGIATPAQIDMAATQHFAMPLGPFAVMNIVKPRVMLQAMRNLGALGPFYTVAEGLARKGATQEPWDMEEHMPPDDTAFATITQRLMSVMFFPVLDALDRGVAQPEAFDTGAQIALRMSQGPIAQMRAMGRDEVLRILQTNPASRSLPVPLVGLAVAGL